MCRPLKKWKDRLEAIGPQDLKVSSCLRILMVAGQLFSKVAAVINSCALCSLGFL